MLGMRLGSNSLMGVYLGGDPMWNWSPSQLFAGGKAGFWLGRKAYQENRLSQDSAGTLPVSAIGQFVGKASRKAGTADALQSTALSRPALGRWPKGARARNLFKGSESFANAAYWVQTSTEAGVVKTLTTTTGSVAKYRFNGTASAAAVLRVVNNTTTHMAVKAGDKITVKAVVKVVTAGFSWGTGDGFRLDIITRNAAGAQIDVNFGPVVPAAVGVATPMSRTFTATMDGFISLLIAVRASSGVVFTDTEFEFSGTQIDKGEVATAYQATDTDGVPLAGYGQVRNLAVGAQAVGDPMYWQDQYTSNGVTVTLVDSGLLPDGTPLCRYYLSGTVAASPIRIGYLNNNSRGQLGADRARVAKISIAVPVGDLEVFNGCRCDIQLDVNATYLAAINGNSVKSREPQISQSVFDGISHPTATHSVATVVISSPVGSILNHEVEVFGLQFERGLTPTPLQLNYGPNNVTEQGVDDVWFLVNDGNDALPVALPVGTYGVAFVNPAGGITFTTQTLSSDGNVDTLRGTRMDDVIVRQDDFTAQEKTNIERFWGDITA